MSCTKYGMNYLAHYITHFKSLNNNAASLFFSHLLLIVSYAERRAGVLCWAENVFKLVPSPQQQEEVRNWTQSRE